jgi:hypothetical protein
MTQGELEGLAEALKSMANVFSEPMGEEKLLGYCGLLSRHDYHDVIDALDRCARTCTFFPKVAEIDHEVTRVIGARQADEYVRTLDAIKSRCALTAPPPPTQITDGVVTLETGEQIDVLAAREKLCEVFRVGIAKMPILTKRVRFPHQVTR